MYRSNPKPPLYPLEIVVTKLAALLEDELIPFNTYLEDKSPEEILDWTFSVFPRIALLTSGQKAGSVLAKVIHQAGKQVDLIFADTGILFDETQETIQRISETYQFPLKRYTPTLSISEQTAKHGVLYLDHAGQEDCCHMRKVEPLLEVYREYEVFLGPLRREEGGRRSKVPILSLDTTMKVIRVNVIANLKGEDYQRHLDEPDTIINPLHKQGFPTIGCNRCTTPVRGDESSRAGRWRHLSGVDYCGINPSDFMKKSASIEIDEDIRKALAKSLKKINNL